MTADYLWPSSRTGKDNYTEATASVVISFDGKIDGGEHGLAKTQAAILAFRNDNGLPTTPDIDDDLLVAVATAKPSPIAASRANATAKDVALNMEAAAGKSKLAAMWLAATSFVGGLVKGMSEHVETANASVAPVRDFLGDIPSEYDLVGVSLLAFFIWRSAQRAEHDRAGLQRGTHPIIVKSFISMVPAVGQWLSRLFGVRPQTLRVGIVIDRHATSKERARWVARGYEATTRTLSADLHAEKAARASDLKTIDGLERQKAKADKANDALKLYIDTLPKGDQCIATPGRLRQLHKAR